MFKDILQCVEKFQFLYQFSSWHVELVKTTIDKVEQFDHKVRGQGMTLSSVQQVNR